MAELPIFAYGTLQVPEVCTALLGRMVRVSPAIVEGHRCVRLGDALYPGLIRARDATADGLLLWQLTEYELALLDEFEDPIYERQRVDAFAAESNTSVEAWSYVVGSNGEPVLTNEGWDLDTFVALHAGRYVKQCRRFRANYLAKRQG